MDNMFIKRLISFFLCIVSVFTYLQISIAEEINMDEPIALIEKFYENLFSDKEPKDCAEIFYEGKLFKQGGLAHIFEGNKIDVSEMSNNEIIWRYLRENKELFIFKSIGNPIEIPECANKGDGSI